MSHHFRKAVTSRGLIPVLGAAFVSVDLSSGNSKSEKVSTILAHYRDSPRHLQSSGNRCVAFCEAPKLNHSADYGSSQSTEKTSSSSSASSRDSSSTNESTFVEPSVEGFQSDAVGDFHGLFPARQFFQPSLPYPLWNKNWDGRHPERTDDAEYDRKRLKTIRKTGTTRHIILIRHGQYDESRKEDEHRKLTPLGQQQAHLTGKRIAEMMRGAEGFEPCNVTNLRVSAMTRARETADIIASHLDSVVVGEPNPAFNEGRPCHTIPGGPASEKTVKITDENHPRIEQAFRTVFARADEPGPDDEEKHDFEIIVCHANVIRYFMCRALQLPPEAWLRYCPFNCSLTYITIRPTGNVSCRMLGDIGHLPYNMVSHSHFSWTNVDLLGWCSKHSLDIMAIIGKYIENLRNHSRNNSGSVNGSRLCPHPFSKC